MIGFINVYKPSGMTSNDVVQKIKRKFNISKIGHMGTLDPMACGLLPIAIGKATRLFDYLLEKTKTYRVVFDFGYETDTLDITGEIINKSDIIPSFNQIQDVIFHMIGVQNQIPPKYSAKNINGRRAYDLARSGVDFELKPKEIEIFNIDLIEQVDENKFKFDITCSSGTYIRAIGRDMAYALCTYASMSSLERRETGVFNLDNSIKLDDLLNSDNLDDVILSPIDVMKSFDSLKVDENIARDLVNGKSIDGFQLSRNTFIIYNNEILGISKPRMDILKLDTFLKE